MNSVNNIAFSQHSHWNNFHQKWLDDVSVFQFLRLFQKRKLIQKQLLTIWNSRCWYDSCITSLNRCASWCCGCCCCLSTHRRASKQGKYSASWFFSLPFHFIIIIDPSSLHSVSFCWMQRIGTKTTKNARITQLQFCYTLVVDKCNCWSSSSCVYIPIV